MNLTDTYPGRPLRQVRTVALPVRKRYGMRTRTCVPGVSMTLRAAARPDRRRAV